MNKINKANNLDIIENNFDNAHSDDKGVEANSSDELYVVLRSQIGEMVLQGVVGQALSFKPNYNAVMGMISSAIRNQNFAHYFEKIYNYDKNTFEHSMRVAIYSLILAIRLELADEDKQAVVIGALLHDIGKINIPHHILTKPSKLDDNEMKLIQNHSNDGYNMLKDDKHISADSLYAIKHHHERYDGKGYPAHLRNDDIRVFAKIVSIADIYDAVTSRRVHKSGLPLSYSIRYIESLSNNALCEKVVEHFIIALGIFPVGTTIMLDSNEIAVIEEGKKDNSFMPIVKIIIDGNNALLDNPYIFDLNNKDDNGNYIKSIKKIMKKDAIFNSLLS